VTARICVELLTVGDDVGLPPKETVAPPAVGPELGETLVTTGEDGGAMFALKPAEVDWFVESVTFTEIENVPD
jgi:hypothetical protein